MCVLISDSSFLFSLLFFFFFFNDTATTEIYTLSLHDALPIWTRSWRGTSSWRSCRATPTPCSTSTTRTPRSEEHTSELQSRPHLVCRLLLEKKKKKTKQEHHIRQIKHTHDDNSQLELMQCTER